MALLRSKGKITLLRAQDVGQRFGPPGDSIDAEVIFKVSTHEDAHFGFQLRDDENRPVRQAMLDLLRDAFSNGWDLGFVYDMKEGRSNAIARRVWIIREPSDTPGGTGPSIMRPGFGALDIDKS